MVYIHIPFCKSFCTYCDFYSELCSRKESARVQKLFADAVCAEVVSRKEEIEAASSTRTLYVGGGTPSVLFSSHLERIVHSLGTEKWEEATIEVNPDDITSRGITYVRGLMDMGFSRISMGVQSFDDGILKWMCRRHGASQACEAFEILRDSGIGNISIDLMFGISQLTDEQWMATIRKAVKLHPEHISAYQLSIEEGSSLSSMVKRGEYVPAADDRCRDQYDILCKELSCAGYHHYEISNFALPGKEAVHNGAYWTRKPYVGLGPGAHSFDGESRSWNSTGLLSWTRESEQLTDRDHFVETVMLALRTDSGIEAGYLESHCNPDSLERLLNNGCLVRCGSRIRIPESEFFVSDSIISDII